jgi:hypothetical protein
MLELPAEKPIQIIRTTEMPELPPSYPELPAEKPIRSIPRKELPTRANDLELDARPTAAELQGPALDRAQGPDNRELETRPTATELRSSAWEVPKQTFSQPFQPLPRASYVGGHERAAEANAPPTHEPGSSRASSQTLLSDMSTDASSSRMDELRAKRDKIRTEKERLLKLQELDEMEAAVQREMLEEAKK